MKKIIITSALYFLTFGVLFQVTNVTAKTSNTSVSVSNLRGTWILTGIDAKDLVEININSQSTEAIDNNGVQKNQTQKMSIPLDKILKKELSIGTTKFIFNDGTFSFYRQYSLTFSGNWTLSSDELALSFKSAEKESVKQNKIIKLTDKLLVMESESYGKKVVFTFEKK